MSVDIRELSQHSEYDSCVEIQLDVWKFDPIEVVPAAHLVAMHQYGGLCLGAFDEKDRMVGFAVGFAGWNGNYRYHHSHMLAVRQSHRGQGLGERLKWTQRDHVLPTGIGLVNWTFDPLQAPNANLNINRLGAVVGKYKNNVYGESQSPLHGGIPTDRFEAEWRLASERVASRAETAPTDLLESAEGAIWKEIPCATNTGQAKSGLLVCESMDTKLDTGKILVEIPPRITELMAVDKALALDWRMKTRDVFSAYFSRGYWVVALHRSDGRTFYELQKDFPSYEQEQ